MDNWQAQESGDKPSEKVAEERAEQNTRPRWVENAALGEANQVDDWLAIEPDGQVVVMSGKVELGTGTRTALAQIVAEELDVALERITMVMGDTERTPNEGYTAGSKTLQNGGAALRLASAEARAALLEMASDRLDAAVDELHVTDGVISVTHHPDRSTTFAQLAGGRRFNRPISGKAPLKRAADYRIVGRPIERLDLPAKLSGEPSFVQDVRLPGMLHGRVLLPPGPGAQLQTLDDSAARDLPGLVKIIHLNNYVAVVAEREEMAEKAAKALVLQWGQPTAVPSMEKLYDYIRNQPANDEVVEEEGEVEAALESAALRLEALYFQPYQAHASIGPSCAVADYREGRVTAWTSTQGVYPLRAAIADLLELDEERVHLIQVEGAGCYGHNGSDDVTADAVILSREVGRPVRVQWTREQEFAWEPKAPAMVMRRRAGLDDRGNLVAWDAETWSPTHAARAQAARDLVARQLISGLPARPRAFYLGGDRNAPTNYVAPNSRVTMHWLPTSPLRASSMRSLGAVGNTLANESFMDELASAARSDPLEFRLRHLQDPRARAVLEAAAERAGWQAHVSPRGGREGRLQGTGLAFCCYENEEAYLATIVRLELETTTGEVRLVSVAVAHDCGLIVNPDGLRNQIEGNVIQSASRALKEEVKFDETGITSLDWESYPIFRFSDIPEIDIVLINRPEHRAVGAGEPASTTTAAAIANAIFDACGVRLRQVPFTPARVMSALAGKS